MNNTRLVPVCDAPTAAASSYLTATVRRSQRSKDISMFAGLAGDIRTRLAQGQPLMGTQKKVGFLLW